jgi:hypothetical protein
MFDFLIKQIINNDYIDFKFISSSEAKDLNELTLF